MALQKTLSTLAVVTCISVAAVALDLQPPDAEVEPPIAALSLEPVSRASGIDGTAMGLPGSDRSWSLAGTQSYGVCVEPYGYRAILR